MTTISACLIVRDEESMLPECLASIRPWVDEICVVDTGSSDSSREIAASFGARVATQAWEDDFSRARNVSLEMATCPWILVIDADERLDASSGPTLRKAVEAAEPLALLVTRHDLRPSGPPDRTALPRLFRSRPDIRFTRPVHENVMDALFAAGTRELSDSGVRLVHVGYLPDVLKARDKHGRNLALLRRRHGDAPDDLYSAYKLALTLPAAARDEKLAAFACADALVARLLPAERAELPFLPRLFDAHAGALTSAGELARATEMADRGRELFPEAPDLLHRRGELARRQGDLAAAATLVGLAMKPRETSTVRAERPREVLVRCWLSVLALAFDGADISALPLEGGAPDEVAIRCALLRLALAQGRVEEVASGIARLLETAFDDDEVRLLAGEFAWSQGDGATARSMWDLTTELSDAGHRAHAWLALSAAARGEFKPAARKPREAAVAALDGLLARHAGVVAPVDPWFQKDSVERWTQRWERELRRVGARQRRPSSDKSSN